MAATRRSSAQPAARQSVRKAMRITKPHATTTKPKKNSIKREKIEKQLIKEEDDELSEAKAILPLVKSEHEQTSSASPFPTFAHPTQSECEVAHSILVSLHGERNRPSKTVAPADSAGCGASQSVLDALVRTILSQNTSSANSTRAKMSMDAVYGRSDDWEAIVSGGLAKLQETIRCGGLSASKSKAIINMLTEVHEKYGKYSLDHLFEASNEDAMAEMVSFGGVGPKTASCVLLFCLQRPSFAVDTHVYRLTGFLGWRPMSASREQAQEHLDAVVPNDLKYPLHVLFIEHGRTCERCQAKGKNVPCKLRSAFKK